MARLARVEVFAPEGIAIVHVMNRCKKRGQVRMQENGQVLY